jgi:branched-chain amino acid transport system permease protein
VVDAALLGLILAAFLLRRRRLMRVDEGSVSSWAATEEVRPIPPELSGLATVRTGVRRLIAIAVVVIVGVPFILSPGQTSLASSFLIDGMVIVSLVVLTGWGGQVSLGQWGFVAVGAVVGGGLYGRAGLPFLVALILGSLSGSAMAVVLGFASLRVRGLYLAVTTLAFAVAMATVGVNRSYFGNFIAPSVNRPALFSIKTTDERVFYYLCLLALIGIWYAALGLRRTRTGRVLIAMRENERTAQALGVNLVRTRLATFALSGFMAAFAGVLLAVQEHQVSPDAFGPDQSIGIFLAAVIGGLGSIQGALLGALYFAVVSFTLHGAVAQLLASSFGVLLVLMFFPGGLGAVAYAARDAVLRRIAIRRRIWVPSLLPDRLMIGGAERAPLAPRSDDQGAPVPVHYRLPSRIRVAGGSQAGRRWNF